MQRTAALALIGLGVDAVYAEEIERILLENNLETASLDGIHWWSSQRWKFDPAAAVQEARIGWWVSPAIEFQFKRLLDTRFEADPADNDGPILVKHPIVVWDEKTERFIEQAKALMPVAQAVLQRQWAEAWRQWPRYAMNPDIGPALPEFPTLKSLIGYYERVRPQRNDPAHPAHVLRIFLEALDISKAWDEGNVERWPAGTPVDPATGAGGGRFAPKRTGTDPSSRMANYGEYLDKLRADRGPKVDVDVHLADIKEKAGERTAYAPELWPDLPPDAQAELDAFEADTAYETIERLQMYDAEGRIMGETVGEYNRVKTPVPEGFYPGSIVTHNHPNLSALSDADLMTGFSLGAREFRAVSGEYAWVAKLPVMPTQQARRAMMGTVSAEWRKAEEAAKTEVLEYMQRQDGEISPAVVNHIYGELITQKFVAQVEPLYGIQIERQRLAPERRLTATEAKAVSSAWRADFAGMYTLDGGEVVGGRRADAAVKDSKIAVWREVPADTNKAAKLGNEELSAKVFDRAAKGGATSIMHVSDTRLSRLYLKRPLSDEERSKIVKAYEANTERYKEHVSRQMEINGGGNVQAWANVSIHETNRIRAVAWRDTAAQHPDLIEFHSDFVPGFDPVELVASEGWKPGKQNGWPFKTWNEDAHPRHPAGTPVDDSTGAGGGRFAPKDGSAAGPTQSDERSAEQISADVMAKAEGKMGIVMPDKWPALPPETEAEIDAWHRAHVHDSFETMRIYDPAGNLVGEWAGDSSSVVFPEDVEVLPGSVLIHNHPSTIAPISDADVIESIRHGIRRVEAVSGERIWSMELPVQTYRALKIVDIEEAYDRAFQMTDAVLKPLMNATENPLSTADANLIAREMMVREFMREYGEQNGFKLTVRPTGTAFELSDDDAALTERVQALDYDLHGLLAVSDGEIYYGRKREEGDNTPEGATYGTIDVIVPRKAERIIWRSEPASRWSAYERGAVPSEAFAIATTYGYGEVLGISDFAVDRLRVKRALQPEETQRFKEEHDRRVREEMDRVTNQLMTQRFANETTVHAYVTKQKESSIAAKAWADMAAEYPDIFEYATAMIPSRDPLEIVKKPEFDTYNLDHENPYAGWLSFKTWDESKVERWPAGTPVDPATGAGGGRFAPKNGEGSASVPRSAHGIYTELLLKARGENREEIAAEEWPALPKSTEEEIAKFGRAITWDGIESLRVYDAAGNLVAEAEGDHQSVTLPASATWVPGGVAVHNHPNQSGVSPRDVAMAVSTGVREIRATAGEYVWIMELPVFPDSRVRAASVGEYSAAINDTRRLANSMIGNRLDAGEITVQEANHLARAMVDDYFVERRGERLGVSLRVERLWPERPLTDDEIDVIGRVRGLDETIGMLDAGGETVAVYRSPKTKGGSAAFINSEPPPLLLRTAANNGSRLVLGVSDERVSRLYLKRTPTAKELDNIEKRWNEAFAAERKRTGQRMYDEGYDLDVIDLEIEDRTGVFQTKAWRTVADEHPDLIEYRNEWHKDLDPVELAKNDAWRKLKTNSWETPTKAWDEEAHPRHPEGTPVDESTGAGGGRFAPKDGSAPGSAGDVVAEMAGEQTAFRNEPLEGYGEISAEPVFVWLNTIKEETGEDAAFLMVDDIYAGMPTTPPRQTVLGGENRALEQSFGRDNELAEEAAAKVAEVVDNHPVAIAMDSAAVAGILADGRVKNQYETGETGGLFDPEYRIGIERSLYGIPKDADPAQRPIYGYVKFGNPMVREYGAWDAVLRDDIKDRATLTAGDSIMDNEETVKVGVPMRRVGDTIAYFGAHGEDAISIIDDGGSDYNMMEYFEVQVHGGVSLDDIDHFVPPEFEKDSDPEVIAALESHGFTFDGSVYRRATPPAGDVVAEMAGETQTGEGSADYDVPLVWDGVTQYERPEKMPSKFMVGELAENLTRQIMSDIVGDDFKTLNSGRNNAPLDVFGDHMAIEVKAGLASNGRTAQHWRATIGEPGKGEKELLAKMSPEEKKRHNAWKGEEILKRKAALVEQLAQYTSDGEPVKPVTVGMIFKPDLTAVDVYVIDGHHLYLAWNQHATEENYLDTFKVNPQWPK